MTFLFRITLLAVLFPLSLVAEYHRCPDLFTLGPEIYYLRRTREGGTEQNGVLYGVRGGYDRIKRYGWYLGGDFLWAKGEIEGHTGRGRELCSKISDFTIEGRLGYTLQKKENRSPFFALFGGYGYFREENDFRSPSPLPITFTDTFKYVVAGFLSGVNFTSLLSINLNFKVRFMTDGESKVTDDPMRDDVTLMMNNETHYRLDIPITYYLCSPHNGFELRLAPFYEFRHFGGREGFPFDFFDTKFHLAGGTLSLGYRF